MTAIHPPMANQRPDLVEFFIARPALQSVTLAATGEVIRRGDVLLPAWAERHFDAMARPMTAEIGGHVPVGMGRVA